MFLFFIILVAVGGGIFAGFYSDTHYLHPPKDVYGVCPSPAYVTVNNDCIIKVISKDASGNQVATYQNGGIVNGTGGH